MEMKRTGALLLRRMPDEVDMDVMDRIDSTIMWEVNTW